jgi:hypothetical protein
MPETYRQFYGSTPGTTHIGVGDIALVQKLAED